MDASFLFAALAGAAVAATLGYFFGVTFCRGNLRETIAAQQNMLEQRDKKIREQGREIADFRAAEQRRKDQAEAARLSAMAANRRRYEERLAQRDTTKSDRGAARKTGG